jgi:hypothetical protein
VSDATVLAAKIVFILPTARFAFLVAESSSKKMNPLELVKNKTQHTALDA